MPKSYVKLYNVKSNNVKCKCCVRRNENDLNDIDMPFYCCKYAFSKALLRNICSSF